MFKHLIKWLGTSLAVFWLPTVLSNILVEDFTTALFVALTLGFLNLFIRPILFFITLPITVLTLGFFTLCLNAFMLQIAAHFISGFVIKGFWTAFWASLFVSCVSYLFQMLFTSNHPRPHVQFKTWSNERRSRNVN